LLLINTRFFADEVTSTFSLAISVVSAERFSDYCRRVYFATDDVTPCLFVIVNTGLFYLFQEAAATLDTSTSDDNRAAEYQGYAETCRRNLENGFANLTMFLPASRENIEAMVLGVRIACASLSSNFRLRTCLRYLSVSKCTTDEITPFFKAHWSIELSKPSLAWQMTMTACHLCLTLGYHRATMYSDAHNGGDRGLRLALFWQVYILDRSLSLRLGRAATLKDHDITAPREVSDLPLGSEWRSMFNAWVSQAEIQGNIYDELYSPAALRQPDAHRISVAWGLAEKVKALVDGSTMAQARLSQPGNTGEHHEMLRKIRKTDDVSLHSLLTLVYRALPPLPGSASTFSPHSIEAARAALQAHYCAIAAVAELNNEYLTRGYVHWLASSIALNFPHLMVPYLPTFITPFSRPQTSSGVSQDSFPCSF